MFASRGHGSLERQMLLEMMNTQFQVWAMQSEKAIATRERAMLLADQEALLKSAKERRELEYRSAVLGDVRYWGWAALLVALIAGGFGWWLRGTIVPSSANNPDGTFSTESPTPSKNPNGTLSTNAPTHSN